MGPKLDELIEQGEQLKEHGLFYGSREFWEWHDSCVEFLEYVPLSFREEVMSPLDAEKGVAWLKETFRGPKKQPGQDRIMP